MIFSLKWWNIQTLSHSAVPASRIVTECKSYRSISHSTIQDIVLLIALDFSWKTLTQCIRDTDNPLDFLLKVRTSWFSSRTLHFWYTLSTKPPFIGTFSPWYACNIWWIQWRERQREREYIARAAHRTESDDELRKLV